MVVLFSGGLDSTFLLKAAVKFLGPEVVALTFQGPQCPTEELAAARDTAARLGVRHHIEVFDPLTLPDFRGNTPKRCYACKQAIYRQSLDLAAGFEAEAVLDGAQADDDPAERPGLLAAAELGIRSPLREAGLTKARIRELSRVWGLPGWDRPAQSCLATRFPTYSPLDAETFRKIDALEAWLRQHGFGPVRLRVHGDLLRLELSPEQWQRLLETDMRATLQSLAVAAGWRYLTLDLLGYRSGSMNAPPEKRPEEDT